MNTKTSRRRFFTVGGAALGAGVATSVGASAPTSDDTARDREAIRQLQLAFMSLIEQRSCDEAAELFDEHETGKAAIRELPADHESATAFHSAYRQTASQQKDAITFSDSLHASGSFHVEAQLCTPLQEDCTAATMARLQGNVADLRWEPGRFEVKYVKSRGEWKIASLTYRAS